MTPSIRRLRPGDEAVLERYTQTDHLFEDDSEEDETPSEPLSSAQARAFLEDASVLFWLAEAEGEPVGMLLCYVQRRPSAGPWATVLLEEMGVRRGWRRQGIGRALLRALEGWMLEQGVEVVWVPANTYAVGFYTACGFSPLEGVVMEKQVG